MATSRQFARSRALKLAAALCLVSALAFLLGQGVAAFRVTLTQTPTTRTPPQVIERVSGAQGTIPAPPPAPSHNTLANAATTSPGAAATAAPVALSANLTRATPAGHVGHARGKDKAHAKHKGAAGDSSHGGPSHAGGASQPAHRHGGHGGGGHGGHDK
jgi:type IV secretory pathway VirB10-like protein